MLKCPMDEYTLEALPLLLSVVTLVIIMIAWPNSILFLPNLVFGPG
jgi:TRAP-type C4-dicarboxylate transport system permease large subunit